MGGLTINGYTSSLDLNGNSFQITSGNADLRTGSIIDGTSSIVFTVNSAGNTYFRGTQFDAQVNCTSARIYFNGSVFNAVSTFNKNEEFAYSENQVAFNISHLENGVYFIKINDEVFRLIKD